MNVNFESLDTEKQAIEELKNLKGLDERKVQFMFATHTSLDNNKVIQDIFMMEYDSNFDYSVYEEFKESMKKSFSAKSSMISTNEEPFKSESKLSIPSERPISVQTLRDILESKNDLASQTTVEVDKKSLLDD